MRNRSVLKDDDAVARVEAETIVRLAAEAVAARGAFRLALSGGSTPRKLYSLLAGEPFVSAIDWNSVHLYWGDERCVPPDHGDSNFRMTREALLDRAPIPAANVHRMESEIDPAEAARRYEAVLRETFDTAPGAIPRFDLVLLGMGDDGHTASLFPGTKALDERERLVVENFVPKFDAWRVTMTYPLLNAAARVHFLAPGASKAERIREIFGNAPHETHPSERVVPTDGELLWLLDEASASALG